MTRLDKLKELEVTLYDALSECDQKSVAAVAALAKQYRETIREIEEIEGSGNNEDEIADILNSRSADGKSRAVRPNRSKV
jgi:hypothetical protein